jgi:cyclic beta-1,2-glucan synthetase
MGEGAESVWLTFFASAVLDKLAKLLARRDDPEAEKYARTAEMLGRAAGEAWDGDHFLRGWYPDGTPLGGFSRAEDDFAGLDDEDDFLN